MKSHFCRNGQRRSQTKEKQDNRTLNIIMDAYKDKQENVPFLTKKTEKKITPNRSFSLLLLLAMFVIFVIIATYFSTSRKERLMIVQIDSRNIFEMEEL